MRNAALILLIALPATSQAVENSSKYDAYKQRLAERRWQALERRRAYSAMRGPARYRTAIAVGMPITPLIAIEAGWVRQPPIPIRPWVFPLIVPQTQITPRLRLRSPAVRPAVIRTEQQFR